MCGDQTIDLQDELIGWFLYGLGFCWGYFRTDYSIVLISEAAIAKCPSVFITAAMSFWWFFRLLACSLLKSSFVDIFIICGYFYIFFQYIYIEIYYTYILIVEPPILKGVRYFQIYLERAKELLEF